MAGTFNHELCEDRHRRIDARFEKGEDMMTTLQRCGNNHEQRLAVMEKIAARNESAFWRMIAPLASIVSGVATAVIVAWLLRG